MPHLHDVSGDPAVAALMELLDAERARALADEPALVERFDPGRLWLLWFAIGATDEICRLVRRNSEPERNEVFRRAVSVIFGREVKSDASPATAVKRLIDIFLSAGAEAAQDCVRRESRSGYYLDALRLGASQDWSVNAAYELHQTKARDPG
jgi:hypothetical protein